MCRTGGEVLFFIRGKGQGMWLRDKVSGIEIDSALLLIIFRDGRENMKKKIIIIKSRRRWIV